MEHHNKGYHNNFVTFNIWINTQQLFVMARVRSFSIHYLLELFANICYKSDMFNV